VFVGSLADLFHADVPETYLARVFAVMAATPRHTYQVLTKRHHRMRDWLTGPAETAVRAALATPDHTTPTQNQNQNLDLSEAITWPLPNVWVGVSTETQEWAQTRIPALLDTPAAVRWISAEPLLGPLDLTPWLPDPARHTPGLDWVVAGGESGPGARPMDPDWIRALRDQCALTSTPFHFKQWGEWAPAPARPHDGLDLALPANPAMTRVGKHAAGRALDAHTHDAYPTPVAPAQQRGRKTP
jgi:protein gp37